MECGGSDLEVAGGQQAGELTQERPMTMRRIAFQASLALVHKRLWSEGELHWCQRPWFCRRERVQPRNQTHAFWHLGVVISNTSLDHLPRVRCQVCKLIRDDDEAAQDHVTEHVRKLGFVRRHHRTRRISSGQSTGTRGRCTVTKPPGPSGGEQANARKNTDCKY